MKQVLELSDPDPGRCRKKLREALDELNAGNGLTVQSDHDPAPTLHRYEEENPIRLDWAYEEKGPDRWTLSVRVEQTDHPRLDAREMPPARRHGEILERYDRLNPGESLVLVNDHDPRPLFYELRSLHGETFDWEYRVQEPGEYRVEITKNAASRPLPDEASTRVDTRVIPPADRHRSIFHRYDLLAEGDAMEIVADHDPKPLYHQLKDAYGEEVLGWTYRKQDPGEYRVLLRKEPGAGSSTQNDPANGSTIEGKVEELDVRDYRPQKRHDLVFERYRSLEPGEGFVLVNDHDPKPLYYQIKNEMEGSPTWEYRRTGSDPWRVFIGKDPSD